MVFNNLHFPSFQVCSNADKKKISDIREIKEAYDARLTQVTKSAKLEISRLVSRKQLLHNNSSACNAFFAVDLVPSIIMDGE